MAKTISSLLDIHNRISAPQLEKIISMQLDALEKSWLFFVLLTNFINLIITTVKD